MMRKLLAASAACLATLEAGGYGADGQPVAGGRLGEATPERGSSARTEPGDATSTATAASLPEGASGLRFSWVCA
jgi:hypothetical protein